MDFERECIDEGKERLIAPQQLDGSRRKKYYHSQNNSAHRMVTLISSKSKISVFRVLIAKKACFCPNWEDETDLGLKPDGFYIGFITVKGY
jgi:hypothetical protein